jgi:putative redox protein
MAQGDGSRHRPQETSMRNAPQADPAVAPGTVVVAESGEGRLTQLLLDGRHRLRADEPVAVGGDDAGPDPYALLLMSLGACTAMTLRLYAERRKWPLERVIVRLRHGRIHAEDCATCETKTGLVDHIDREIELQGALEAEQRGRLLAIADKCPVHRTLTAEVDIATRLITPAE